MGEPTYTIRYTEAASGEVNTLTLSRERMRAQAPRYAQLIRDRIIRDVTVTSRNEDVTGDWFG